MKFTSIFVALTILSIISVSYSRTSSRSKTRVADVAAGPKLVEYTATLTIKDETSLKTQVVKIDQESFNQMNYGIQFSMETGAITHPAFFLVTANTYLFDFKHAHAFNCLNQATFTQKSMHFAVNVARKNYDVVFTFPNGWAFGSSVNLATLCNKFYERWTNMKSKRSGLETDIYSTYSHIKMLELTRKNNQNNKAGLLQQNADFAQAILSYNSTVITTRRQITTISREIDSIGAKSATESQKLNTLEDQIRELEAKMVTQQNFIDETSGNISTIHQITESEINNEWSQFSVTLDKMIDLQSQDDPLKSTLNGLKSNVKGNAQSIMNALRI
jgi:predicted  nucleic acid-binding Zn-ribbon protein